MNKQELLKSLASKGFSEKILKAFENVKREDFIPENLKKFSYEDNPLPIGFSQTISQPYTIAFMLNLLELNNMAVVSQVLSDINSFNIKVEEENQYFPVVICRAFPKELRRLISITGINLIREQIPGHTR